MTDLRTSLQRAYEARSASLAYFSLDDARWARAKDDARILALALTIVAARKTS